MGDSKIASIPYEERTDEQRLKSNWMKARGQFDREDWSACIVRGATSAEIAANIYIRQFLLVDYKLSRKFVDALLLGANGLDGKFKRLIKPAAECLGNWKELRPLQKKIELLNGHRNGVVHGGKFKNKRNAMSVFEYSLTIIHALAPQEAAGLSLPFES